MILKGHYALCFTAHASFGAHHENLNEGRPQTHTFSDEDVGCSLVSGNYKLQIRILPILFFFIFHEFLRILKYHRILKNKFAVMS